MRANSKAQRPPKPNPEQQWDQKKLSGLHSFQQATLQQEPVIEKGFFKAAFSSFDFPKVPFP